jgi:hypothetical protein
MNMIVSSYKNHSTIILANFVAHRLTRQFGHMEAAD